MANDVSSTDAGTMSSAGAFDVDDVLDGSWDVTEPEEVAGSVVPPAEPGTAVPHASTNATRTPPKMTAGAPPRVRALCLLPWFPLGPLYWFHGRR